MTWKVVQNKSSQRVWEGGATTAETQEFDDQAVADVCRCVPGVPGKIKTIPRTEKTLRFNEEALAKQE